MHACIGIFHWLVLTDTPNMIDLRHNLPAPGPGPLLATGALLNQKQGYANSMGQFHSARTPLLRVSTSTCYEDEF